MTGIEPAYSAWEADTLPLSYICGCYPIIIHQNFPSVKRIRATFFKIARIFFVFTFYSMSPALAKPSITDPNKAPTITYSQYENGQRQLPIGILIALARFYHTSTDYLLGLTDEQKPYP